jgi:anti-anti-sigma factor
MLTSFNVSVRRGGPTPGHGESLTVAVDGELDIATAPQFAARFDEFLADGLRQIVVDVSRLTFIDVSGLRALSALRARARQRRIAVRLSGMSLRMGRLMRMTSPARDFRRSGPTDAVVPDGKLDEGRRAGDGPLTHGIAGGPRTGRRRDQNLRQARAGYRVW